jgi:hypothetical protein
LRNFLGGENPLSGAKRQKAGVKPGEFDGKRQGLYLIWYVMEMSFFVRKLSFVTKIESFLNVH